MSDTYWLLTRGAGRKDIPIDYTSQANPWPTPRRGRVDTYDCRFVPNPRTDYSTLADAALTGHTTRYEAVKDYFAFDPAVSTISLNDGGVVFDESDVSPLSPVETHFVGVVPPDALDVPEFYAVVTGGSVTTTASNARYRIDLEMTYLAAVDDYTTRSAARQNLEA